MITFFNAQRLVSGIATWCFLPENVNSFLPRVLLFFPLAIFSRPSLRLCNLRTDLLFIQKFLRKWPIRSFFVLRTEFRVVDSSGQVPPHCFPDGRVKSSVVSSRILQHSRSAHVDWQSCGVR